MSACADPAAILREQFDDLLRHRARCGDKLCRTCVGTLSGEQNRRLCQRMAVVERELLRPFHSERFSMTDRKAA